MVDYKTQITSLLNTILPTYYEYFLGDDITLPCITYIESDNAVRVDGDTMRYSYLTFTIKLYAYTVADIATYGPEIDEALKSAGFERLSSNEMKVNSQIVKIMNYRATALETEN